MHSYKIGLYTLEEAELQQFKNSLCAERSIIQNAFIVFVSKKKNAGMVRVPKMRHARFLED